MIFYFVIICIGQNLVLDALANWKVNQKTTVSLNSKERNYLPSS